MPYFKRIESGRSRSSCVSAGKSAARFGQGVQVLGRRRAGSIRDPITPVRNSASAAPLVESLHIHRRSNTGSTELPYLVRVPTRWLPASTDASGPGPPLASTGRIRALAPSVTRDLDCSWHRWRGILSSVVIRLVALVLTLAVAVLPSSAQTAGADLPRRPPSVRGRPGSARWTIPGSATYRCASPIGRDPRG